MSLPSHTPEARPLELQSITYYSEPTHTQVFNLSVLSLSGSIGVGLRELGRFLGPGFDQDVPTEVLVPTLDATASTYLGDPPDETKQTADYYFATSTHSFTPPPGPEPEIPRTRGEMMSRITKSAIEASFRELHRSGRLVRRHLETAVKQTAETYAYRASHSNFYPQESEIKQVWPAVVTQVEKAVEKAHDQADQAALRLTPEYKAWEAMEQARQEAEREREIEQYAPHATPAAKAAVRYGERVRSSGSGGIVTRDGLDEYMVEADGTRWLLRSGRSGLVYSGPNDLLGLHDA